MQVAVTSESGRSTVVVSGEIDADNCTEFGDAVRGGVAVDEPLDIDMASVGFVDSSGVSELLAIRSTFEDRGQAVRIVNPSRPVRRVLEVTGLLTAFHVE